MTKYKVLIIGCGGQGVLADAKGSGNEHKVISFAHACKEREDIFDIYYHDSHFMKTKMAEFLWGGKSITPFISISLMLPKNYDIIIVTNPDDSHFATLIEILECYKPKLVICEKPLCSTVEEARQIVKLYEEAKIPILVNYTRRFIKEYQDLIGKVGMITCDYNRGKLHTLTHALDLCTMYEIENYDNGDFSEFSDKDRHWDLTLYDKKGKMIFHEQRHGDMPVPSYYDFHTRYVMQNAINYLEGKEELKCNMYDGLKALERLEEFKSGI